MIKEMNCCTIQCDKCLDYLEVNNDITIIYGNKKQLIEWTKELGWILLETGEAICKCCLGNADLLSAEEKYCMSK